MCAASRKILTNGDSLAMTGGAGTMCCPTSSVRKIGKARQPISVVLVGRSMFLKTMSIGLLLMPGLRLLNRPAFAVRLTIIEKTRKALAIFR